MRTIIRFVIIIMLLFTGCTSTKFISIDPAKPQFGIERHYTLNDELFATVGSNMIHLEGRVFQPQFEPRQSIVAFRSQRKIVIKPNQIWVVEAASDSGYVIKNRYMRTPDGKLVYKSFYGPGLYVTADGRLVGNRMKWVYTNNGSTITSNTSSAIPKDPYVFKPLKDTGLISLIEWDVTYVGRVGDVITLRFFKTRNYELYGDSAQDIMYDLNNGRTITFQSLWMEVIDADNTGIKFKVIDDNADMTDRLQKELKEFMERMFKDITESGTPRV